MLRVNGTCPSDLNSLVTQLSDTCNKTKNNFKN